MGLLIVRHKVKDFATWKKAFDGHAAAQKAAGLIQPRFFDQPMILTRWSSCST